MKTYHFDHARWRSELAQKSDLDLTTVYRNFNNSMVHGGGVPDRHTTESFWCIEDELVKRGEPIPPAIRGM